MTEKKEITCDIINDLIPSYVDEICSKDSKKLVTEHIQTCTLCRQTVDRLKNTTFTTDQTETQQLNYMRRVKQKYTNISQSGFRLLILLVAFTAFYMLYEHGNKAFGIHYIVQLLLIIGTYLILSQTSQPYCSNKLSNLLITGNIITITYIVLLTFFCYQWIVTKQCPFNIELTQLGPFVVRLLLVAMCLLFLIFTCCLLLTFKNITVKKLAFILPITGCCMALILISTFRNLSYDVHAVFVLIIKRYLLLVIEATVTMFVIVFYEKHWKRSK